MTGDEKFVHKYKDTISIMNDKYDDMLWHYEIGDLRSEYIKTFEYALALNLAKPLWENPRYFRTVTQYPLPKKGGYIQRETYDVYLMLYDYIMRDAGLLQMRKSGDEGEEYDNWVN